jgi:hypothetical protein
MLIITCIALLLVWIALAIACRSIRVFALPYYLVTFFRKPENRLWWREKMKKDKEEREAVRENYEIRKRMLK